MNLESIISIGKQDTISNEENERIVVTNFIGILLSLLCVPFTVICLLWLPEGRYLGFLFIAFASSSILCNKYHYYKLAKALIVYCAPLICYWFSILVLYPDPATHFSSLSILYSIFFLTPWLVYGLENLKNLISGLFYSISLLFLFPFVNDLFPVELSETYIAEVFATGWGIYLCMGTFLSFYAGALFYFLKNKQQSEVKNLNLLDSINERAEELERVNKKTDDFIAELETKREADKRRSWVDKGLTIFSSLLRENESIELLYQDLISQLIKYLDASQGGLYIINTTAEEPHLDLVSSSSFTREQFEITKIEFGEGIVGRVAMDKELMVLDNLPDTFYKVSSGLGEALPTSVIVVPMITNDEIFGVVELATFKPLDKYHIEFLERVSEMFASTLGVFQNNEKNRILLEDTQTAAQNFKQQEEGLIEMIEELQFAQDSQDDKEAEYLERIKELEDKLSNQ